MWCLNKIAALIFSISFTASVACNFSPQARADSSNNEIEKEKGRVAIKLVLSQFGEKDKCKAIDLWRWGTERRCPKNVIEKLQVNYGKERAFVSLSAFSDLGNIRSVDIETYEKTSDFVVIIKGGDAALSYTARLSFKGKLLLERVVQHGEFPKRAWERTTYRFNY